MKHYTIIAFWVTGIWLAIVIIGVLVILNTTSQGVMSLNEWGDFLAGVSAPLALFWLVVGYFQHGEELRLNTKALKAQQEELQRQVEETAILAKNSGRQASAAEQMTQLTKIDQENEVNRKFKEAQPIFYSGGGNSDDRIAALQINNNGGSVDDIYFTNKGTHQVRFTQSPPGSESVGTLTIKFDQDTSKWPVKFSLSYKDELEKKSTKIFELTNLSTLTEIPCQDDK